jgi:putative ABC transport system substrate-binding protein
MEPSPSPRSKGQLGCASGYLALGDGMRRRDFLGTIIGAAAASPFKAHAQQAAIPVIGFLSGTSPDAISHGVAGFYRGLAEGGYVENRNLLIEYRWAHGQYDTVPKLARELVSRNVAAVAAFGPPAAQAMKAATSTIPFVFTTGADVVKTGLVASLNRPGGNATGVNLFTQAVAPKRLELLDEIIPKGAAVGFLLNPSNPATQGTTAAVEQAARLVARQLHVRSASNESEIDAAFAAFADLKIGGVVVNADPYFDERQRRQIVALAARYALPTAYPQGAYILDGGLISYGTSIADAYRLVALYITRILKGEKAADLPVLQPTTFELMINLAPARALGLTIPTSVLARADEVIE